MLRSRAGKSSCQRQLAALPTVETDLILRAEAPVGGGSLPGETLPTVLLALDMPRPDSAAAALRQYGPTCNLSHPAKTS